MEAFSAVTRVCDALRGNAGGLTRGATAVVDGRDRPGYDDGVVRPLHFY
jgi:hypothetical protein